MEKIQARSRLKPKKEPTYKKYLQYIFCLFVALIAYFLIYLLIKNVYPTQIQNFILKNSYSPLILLAFVANFFLFTFILLNKKYGLIIAFIINLIFYFRLNQINFDLAGLLIIFLISTGLVLLVFPPRLFYNKS